MTDHEEHFDALVSSVVEDPVAQLRATVERALIPVERLDEWESELLEALAGPSWTPLLRRRMAQLRATAQECRELGDAMLAAASRIPTSPIVAQPATDRADNTGERA
jgi:hypothetical protein